MRVKKMKKLFTALTALALTSCAASKEATETTAAKTVNIDGSVSDSMCGLEHEGMIKAGGVGSDDVSCVNTCVKNGYNYVIADKTANRIYKVSDESQLKPFASKKVKVTGELTGSDANNPVLNVTSITPM